MKRVRALKKPRGFWHQFVSHPLRNLWPNHRYNLIGFLTLCCLGVAMSYLWLNLQVMERNRMVEYRALAGNIGQAGMTMIINKQYDDLLETMNLLVRVPNIEFMAFYSGPELAFMAETRHDRDFVMDAEGLKQKEISRIVRGQSYAIFNVPLPFHPDLFSAPGTVQIVFSLQDFMNRKANILLVFAGTLLLVIALVILMHRLNQIRGRLASAEATKAGMISGLTHHAIKFLTVVQGQITKNEIKLTAGKAIDPRELKKDLMIAGQSIDSLNRLIENLNDHERLQKGEVRVLPEPMSLRERIEEAVRSLGEMAGRRGIHIEYSNIYDSMEISGDSHVIQQVLINLLQNAVQYSPAQGIVKIWQVREPENISIYISDQGPGIDPKAWEKIFTPFTRLIPEIKGTGLGLSNSRQLIRLIGGELGVQTSNKGQGTTFYIQIPISGRATGAGK